MISKYDITFVLSAPDTYFFCEKCKTKFKLLEEAEFLRWKILGIEDAEAAKIVERHINICNGSE